MKKSILLFILLSVLSSLNYAQTPQYYNYNTTNNGNTFPFGTAGGRMCQWLIRPGEINQPVQARTGNITKFYCMIAANFGPFIYTNLSILFGQTTLTVLPTSVFYTGERDTVYKRASDTLTGIAQNWLSFTLDHPFLYDSTKSLIIQVEQMGSSGSASYVLGETYLTGIRKTYSTPYPFNVQGQNAYVPNFGIDITPVTGIKHLYNMNVPYEYKLGQNYPNPFNPSTCIKFDIAQSGFVNLRIFDLLGREVITLVNELLLPGSYEVEWDAGHNPCGIYFYKLTVHDFKATKQMMLIK